jgi:hypothetical protein
VDGCRVVGVRVVGNCDGCREGGLLGTLVGTDVGAPDGLLVVGDGDNDGFADGFPEGCTDDVGKGVGRGDGWRVDGSAVVGDCVEDGIDDGSSVGDCVVDGIADGSIDGYRVSVGDDDGVAEADGDVESTLKADGPAGVPDIRLACSTSSVSSEFSPDCGRKYNAEKSSICRTWLHKDISNPMLTTR